MTLNDTLESIVRNLREGRYQNEQAISQGVVLRVLTDLGWDQWNPGLVWPEYSVGTRRVDFALCFPARKPIVFVEVKQPGKGEGADQQLFEYAFHEGVPMAVLCDGRTWGFYLPGEQGSYEERRVYKLDLFEQPAEMASEQLTKYLSCSRIQSGEAVEQARKDYRDQSRRQTSRRILAEAWKSLVEDEDPTLVERLSTDVEAKCGIRPHIDDVTQFLQRLGKDVASASASAAPTQSQPRPAVSVSASSGPIGFTLRGKWFACRTAKDVMVGLLRELAQADSSFCEQCYGSAENRGRSRTYISKDRYELYEKEPEFAERHSEEFVPGWFVCTNLSNGSKERVIRMACRVARLAVGVDATYRLD